MSRHRVAPKPGLVDRPGLWLGQNLRNRVLTASCTDLNDAPLLVTLGDAYLRPTLFDRFFKGSLRDNLGVSGPVMVDSGGFTLLKRRGLQFDIRTVECVYGRIRAEILVSLDVPPLPTDDASTRKRLHARTVKNLERLRHVVSPDHFMPVIHGHSLDELERSCEIVQKLCPMVSMVGIGGLVPLLQSGGSVAGFRYERHNGTMGDRADWIADAISMVRGTFTGSHIHVFGIGSTTTAIAVLALGADSVDSLTWRRVASYGAILLPGCSERFPTQIQGRLPSRPVLTEEERGVVARCGCPTCRPARTTQERICQLAKSYQNRALHNAWTLLKEVELYRRAVRSGTQHAFVASRIRKNQRLYRPVARLIGLA